MDTATFKPTHEFKTHRGRRTYQVMVVGDTGYMADGQSPWQKDLDGIWNLNGQRLDYRARPVGTR